MIKEFQMQELFGKGTKTILGFDTPPKVQYPVKDYVFGQWTTALLIYFRTSWEPLFISGPTGCGKTSAVKYIASKLNYPVYEITGHGRMEFSDVVGYHTLGKDGMSFVRGPLPQAMEKGGIFLLNEIDLLDPSVCAGFNSVLDGSPLVIAENGGEVVYPHKMFRFIATANTCGAGDDTGLYQGVLRQNIAFMDRFQAIEAGYLRPEQEEALLESMKLGTDLPIHKMVRYATIVRNLFKTGVSEYLNDNAAQIDVTMSTRTLIRWARLIETYRELGDGATRQALSHALVSRCNASTSKVLWELFQRLWGEGNE